MASTPAVASPYPPRSVHRYYHLSPLHARPVRSDVDSLPTHGFASSYSTSKATSRTDKGKTSKGEREQWQEEEMKGLVLEYLLSGCFGDSAKAFAKEVEGRSKEGQQITESEEKDQEIEENGMEGVEATPPPEDWAKDNEEEETVPTIEENGDDEDLGAEGLLSKDQMRDVRLRRSIRESILSGRIAQTINLIDTHYPSVLASSFPSTSSPSKLPPLHPLSPKQTNSCTPQTFFVLSQPPTTIPPPVASSGSPPIAVVGSTFGSWATSLSPEILSLNLQLQAFVELMRTGHATSALSTPSTPTSSVNGHSGSTLATGEDTGMTSSITSLASSTTSTSLLSTAITASQALLSSIQSLPPSKDKECWERECVDVCGLLAYKELTNCPVRGYLEMSRREGLAEMVNSAILQRTNRTPLPLLALAAREATAVWQTLSEMKVQFPPVPTSSTSSTQNGTTKTRIAKEYCPTFDFSTFATEIVDHRGMHPTEFEGSEDCI